MMIKNDYNVFLVCVYIIIVLFTKEQMLCYNFYDIIRCAI